MSDIQNLTKILQDSGESSYKRRDAFTKLTRLKPPELIPILTDTVVPDGDRYLTQDVVKYLANLKSPDCFAAMERALDADDSYVKTYAIQGLGDMGEPGAVDLLRPFLKDRSYSIRSVAELAVEKLGGLPPTPTAPDSSTAEKMAIVDEPSASPAGPVEPPSVEGKVNEVPFESTVAEPESAVGVKEPVEELPEPIIQVDPEPVAVIEESILAPAEEPTQEPDSPASPPEVSPGIPETTAAPAPFDEGSLRLFFGDSWASVKPIYLELKNVLSSIPEQEARSLKQEQGLRHFHAEQDDDIAALDKEINELKQQLGRQDISISSLNDKLAKIHDELGSPLIGITNMLFSKKETLTRELNNHKHMRNRLTKSAAANKKELKKLLASRKGLAKKLATLEERNDQISGKLKTMFDRLGAVDRQLDDCYENMILSVPKHDLLDRLAPLCGSGDKQSFIEHCLNELIRELQELKRNQELLKASLADLSEEKKLCFSSTDSLAGAVGSGFHVSKNRVKLEFDIYGQLNFEEKSTFWSGFSNANGIASGTGTARTEFRAQKIQWSQPEGLDGRVKEFAESWQNLGTSTARGELIHSMVIAGQHTVKDYIRLIRNQVETGNRRVMP